MKQLTRLFILLFVFGILVTCEKDEPKPDPEPEPDPTTDYVSYQASKGAIGKVWVRVTLKQEGYPALESAFCAAIDLSKTGLG